MTSKLLEMMFQHERWESLVDKMMDKDINLAEVKMLCMPETRLRLYYALKTESIELPPCHQALIPKDEKGKFRTVYVGETIERCLMSLINDCLFDLFPETVHPQCKSYRSGESCGKTVQELSRKMVKLEKNFNNGDVIGLRFDFKSYFDLVSKEAIFNVFDMIEDKLGFPRNTEPVVNFLRKTYASDLVFDLENNLIHQWMGIRQGNACGSYLADVILYELDEFMSNKYFIYYRYSDDLVVFDNDLSEVIDDINNIICKYGVRLNDKKTAELRKGIWYKFLGFQLCHDQITLSKNRIKRFQKEITSRTIDKKNITFNQAKRSVINFLYGSGDGFSWATSCLGVINCKADLDEMNKFLMDCLRAVKVRETKKRKDKISISKIGGLGVVDYLEDRTILRGTGKNVTANRNKTDKQIENYYSIGCLSNVMKIDKVIYEACVRGM